LSAPSFGRFQRWGCTPSKESGIPTSCIAPLPSGGLSISLAVNARVRGSGSVLTVRTGRRPLRGAHTSSRAIALQRSPQSSHEALAVRQACAIVANAGSAIHSGVRVSSKIAEEPIVPDANENVAVGCAERLIRDETSVPTSLARKFDPFVHQGIDALREPAEGRREQRGSHDASAPLPPAGVGRPASR